MDSRKEKLSFKHKISSIWGWIDLEDYESAKQEVALLNEVEMNQPESVDILYELSRISKDFGDCVQHGSQLTQLRPQDPGAWVRFCNALFWNNQIEDAQILAQEKMDEFPDEWDLVYNLSCYLTKLRKFDEALDALKKASSLTSNKEYFKGQAVLDPDLEELWDYLGVAPEEFFNSGSF